MGVAIYCCSRNQKPQNLSYNQSFVFDEQNHKDINMKNTNTNCSGKLNNSNINSLKNKKDSKVNQKNKQLNNLNKKCTFDPIISKKKISKHNVKYSNTLHAVNNRISHIININCIENDIDELKEKEKENNLHDNLQNKEKTLIEKRRKSILNIINLDNVNEIKLKEIDKNCIEPDDTQKGKGKEKNDDNNIIIVDNYNDINGMEEKKDIEQIEENKSFENILEPIIKENNDEEDEDEEEDKNNNILNQIEPLEVLYNNDSKIIESIPRQTNTLSIEIIQEPFSRKQLKTLKKIMIQEELIINEMDEKTIEQIIDSVSYIKVKKGITIYTREDKVENSYYMLDKGKVEYNLDKDKYQLPLHCGIGINALYKHSTYSCSLKAIEKSFLYKLPIEKYKIIVNNFFAEQRKIKLGFISHNFFFNGLKLSILDKIVDCMIKIKYDNKTILVEQDEFNKNIFIIKEGHINCYRDHEIIKSLNSNEMFGEIGIYNSAISLYEYTAEPNSTILSISFEDLFNSIGNDAPKIIMQKIFEKAVKENEFLSKYFMAGENLNKIFNISKIKYYFNDIVCGIKEKKILIPVSGSVFRILPKEFLDKELPQKLLNQQIKNLYLEKYDSLYSSKVNNNSYVKKKLINKKYILINGKLNIDLITVSGNSKYYILGDECLVIEINWADIEKNLIIPNEETKLSLNQRINLIRSIPFFKNLTPLQAFQLSNYVHYQQYKFGKIILENGPNSDRLYLIKSGSVKIGMGNIILGTLEPGMTFGDFNIFEKIEKKANFIASDVKVECYYIEKENYEDIMEKEIINPLKKYLKNNNNNLISLDKLYYVKDLGSGSYGKVYLVHDETHFYALKTANIQQMNEMKEAAKIYINEKNIMFSIHHPFIISLITTFKMQDFLFFLLEYIDGISLRDYINNPKRELRNIEEAKFFLGTMGLVLHYLQKQKIIHRDLKPDNIMIDNTGYLKVIDFGIAIDITGKDYAWSSIGTFHYMAPEVIKGNNYNSSVDYWSVGIIIYEMFYGRLPFGQGETNPLNIYKEILQKKLYLPSESEVGFNEVVKDLLRKNSKKRLSNFSQWKDYKLFNGFDFEALLGLKMKGFFHVNKSLDYKDLKNKNISIVDYMKNISFFSKNYDEINQRNEENELFADF